MTDPADPQAKAVVAVGRTLLAYRTAIALIRFGFTIFKFSQLELSPVARGQKAHRIA